MEIERGDDVVRIALSGELDVSTAPTVDKQLVDFEAGNMPGRVVIDLRGLRFIDSTGLSLLLNADKRTRAAGRELTLVAADGPPRRILDATGLVGRLDVVDEPPAG